MFGNFIVYVNCITMCSVKMDYRNHYFVAQVTVIHKWQPKGKFSCGILTVDSGIAFLYLIPSMEYADNRIYQVKNIREEFS